MIAGHVHLARLKNLGILLSSFPGIHHPCSFKAEWRRAKMSAENTARRVKSIVRIRWSVVSCVPWACRRARRRPSPTRSGPCPTDRRPSRRLRRRQRRCRRRGATSAADPRIPGAGIGRTDGRGPVFKRASSKATCELVGAIFVTTETARPHYNL